MSVAPNAQRTFLKLRRSGIFLRQFTESFNIRDVRAVT
jgi:hypothetical protein